jgi:NodT family efflux transporter outer membrane factor (OMF) lipoprotein
MSLTARTLAVLLAGSCTACSLSPDYRVPPVAIPPSFKEAPGWRPANPADTAARGAWWRAFGDPVLDDLAERAARQNQTVAAAAATLSQALAIVREQRAGLFPTIELAGSGTRSGSFGNGRTVVIDNGTGTGTGDGTGTGGGTTVTTGSSSNRRIRLSAGASWEPDLWGRIGAGLSQTRAQAEASRADLGSAVLSAQGELATNYLQLRALDRQIELYAETLAAFERALQITRNRYEAGVSARVDVVQAESQLATARGDAADLGRQRAQLEHAIAVLVGEVPSSFSVAPVPNWQAPIPAVPGILPATLLERRPDVAGAERAVAAANAAIGVERAAFFPTVQLSADAGVSASTVSGLARLSNSFWSLGVDGLFTLLDFGARRARVEQARAAYEGAVAQYRGTVLAAFQEVEDQLAAARVLEEVARQRQAAATAAIRTQELVTNQYLAGEVAFTDVITAQTTALSARRAAILAGQDRQLTAVALIRAIGGGWAE